MHLFPPEILHNTVEVYHTQIHNRSKAIYWLILCLLGAAFAVLFLVKVDITAQSRGVIHTPFENTAIQTMVYGEIAAYNMAENKAVNVGDIVFQQIAFSYGTRREVFSDFSLTIPHGKRNAIIG